MKANNNFNLTGRLARGPEEIVAAPAGGYVQGGPTAITRIRIAVDGYDRQAKAKKADFFTVTLFGRQAESAMQYLSKGSYISIVGELRDNQYIDKQGNKRYETELIGNDTVFGPKTGGGDPAAAPTPADPNDPFGLGN
jgi:single-strand DNA-binding protein